jgi:uncharacterized DUF497 family protein
MPIVWDERKRLINIAQHGFDFALVESEFDFGSAVYSPAKDGRIMAIGRFKGRLSVLIFRALGEEAISLVSLRIASKKERAAHGSQARRG